ncbi:hypothetical protein F5X97DRAFT_327961 [Nemania serpens]|nr:hypothetical protein F5X97DRAFT_327961 [Nemania serpens]
MPPKRPPPNKTHGGKKPRHGHSPYDEPPAEGQDRRGWGPVPETLGAQSPYPPGRNMYKIRELYGTAAGVRPPVAPWVYFGEDLYNRYVQHTPEEHLVHAVCSVDPNVRKRVAVLGPQSAWMSPHGAWEDREMWGMQDMSEDQAASGPSGQSQQQHPYQQQQSQQQQPYQLQQYQQQQPYQQQQYQQQQYQLQHYQQQQYQQQQYQQQQQPPVQGSSKGKGKEPDQGHGHGGGHKGGPAIITAWELSTLWARSRRQGGSKAFYIADGSTNFTVSDATIIIPAAVVAVSVFQNEFTKKTFESRRPDGRRLSPGLRARGLA